MNDEVAMYLNNERTILQNEHIERLNYRLRLFYVKLEILFRNGFVRNQSKCLNAREPGCTSAITRIMDKRRSALFARFVASRP